MTKRKDTGAWTRNHIERENARFNAPRYKWRTTQGCEVKWFDTEDEALCWMNFVHSFNYGAQCVVDKIQVG